MVKCKICEKEVSDEKLGPHSQKCREVFEYKELLRTIMAKMEVHLDKASAMKNSLETNATKQQNIRHTKKNSFKDLLDLSMVGRLRSSNSNGSQNGMSPAVTRHTNDTDVSNSEDDKTDRMLSTRETLEVQDDSARLMSDADYRKFVEEVRKSMLVLKKVMLYAKSIADWALELSPVCDVGTTTRNELEEDIKEIVDENVLKFLKAFMVDIESYILIREKYLDATHELVRVNSPKSHHSIRQKLNMKRSTSFAIKADSAQAGQFLTAKKIEDSKKKESPSTEKRKLPAGAVSIQIGLGSPSSRRASKVGDFSQLSGATGMASPSMKSISSKALFQTNLNHMAGLSSFASMTGLRKNTEDSSTVLSSFASMAGLRKNTEDSSNLKDKIKATLNQTNLDKSNGSIESGMMSPSMSALKRDPQTNRIKGRVQLASNNATLSAFAKGKVDQKVVVEQPGTPTKRTSSHNSWFKNIRNEDTSALNKFPVTNKEEPTSPKSKTIAPIFTVNAPPKSSKKAEHRDFMDLKGYYSDCQASRSRRTITKSDSNPHDVGFEDFELIKFIGKGAYGNVYLVKKKATGDHYAMKTVDWADRATQNRMKAIKAEKDIYQALEGDFVVKAFWTFHYENLICFVTEYMLGGDFNRILDRLARLDEEQAQFYFSEIVLAVESLHKLKVVHRDLKPDNILMDAKGHIRLTDFGLSQKGINRLKSNATPSRKGSMSPASLEDPLAKARINLMSKLGKDLSRDPSKGRVDFKERNGTNKKSEKSEKIFNFLGKDDYHKVAEKKPFLNKKHKDSPPQGPQGDKKPKMVGTPDYMAPEMIAPEKYDMEGYEEKCMDWWSMGCILYQFLVGITPFCDTSIEAVFDNITNLRMEWPDIGDDEDCISPAAADLIKQLLNPDPKKRLGAKGAEEVKKHPFFKGIDWATLREREAPMIPCSMEDLDIGEAESAEPASPMQGFAITPSKTCKPFDFGAFQMRRLDLLDQANQKTHQELVRQKSGKIQL